VNQLTDRLRDHNGRARDDASIDQVIDGLVDADADARAVATRLEHLVPQHDDGARRRIPVTVRTVPNDH
jgi:hypothetical protein